MKSKNPFDVSSIVSSIISWNNKFPFDLLWRMKYNIPFGSEAHRQMDFFYMKYDIQEEKYFKYLASVRKYGNEEQKQLLKQQIVDENEIERIRKDFDELNIDELNN